MSHNYEASLRSVTSPMITRHFARLALFRHITWQDKHHFVTSLHQCVTSPQGSRQQIVIITFINLSAISYTFLFRRSDALVKWHLPDLNWQILIQNGKFCLISFPISPKCDWIWHMNDFFSELCALNSWIIFEVRFIIVRYSKCFKITSWWKLVKKSLLKHLIFIYYYDNIGKFKLTANIRFTRKTENFIF